jgi:demethylsterigmatocystin 6-O-methyltransferase
VCGPTYQALPDFLLEKGYQNITSNTDTAFNRAWDTKDPCFYWFRNQPKLFKHLHHALQLQHREDYLSKFPLESYLGDFAAQVTANKDEVLFVDVGGSFGIQCQGLKAKYPHLAGRVILQDMKETIDLVKDNPIPGVELMVHDFFQPQSVKGMQTAKVSLSLER